ncbi:MAG: AmmeMemoRadiSam system protein B [Patescibacteria group bacterium]
MPKSNIIIACSILVVLFGIVYIWQWAVTNETVVINNNQINPSIYSAVDFAASTEKLTLPTQCFQEFQGGIVTHHDIASSLVGEFFQCISKSNAPRTIILIGPNHSQQGPPVLSASRDWHTPFGDLELDRDKMEELQGLYQVDDEALIADHSISFMIPYIKYYFPEAKVIPLLVKYSYIRSEADKGIALLKKVIDEQTFILGSLDFSHYLTKNQADKNDKISKEIVTNFDLDDVYNHADGFYDCAPGLFIILSLMQDLEHKNIIELNHANSFDFTGNPYNTTSYFSWLFS